MAQTDTRSEQHFAGVLFTGEGPAVIRAIAHETGQGEVAVLEAIVNRLLVKKGADWTNAILSEYLGLYEDSLGTFALVWDRYTRQLVSHGAVFQSKGHPWTGLVAHIRTAETHLGLGLGTLVTEEVTRAAFDHGARVVALATDDKRHRLQQGEKAAHRMYSKIGYAILAEKELSDTVDWLMAIDRGTFEACQRSKQANGGQFPKETAPEVRHSQRALLEQIRARFSQKPVPGRIQPVGNGDLADLFLLLNLSPPDNFAIELNAWGVHLGPELERAYVVNVRPAIVDQDRLEDSSMALRDEEGALVAVCAAHQAVPFTRNAMDIDFYCLPRLLEEDKPSMLNLVQTTLARLERSSQRPKPCRVLFTGIDAAKQALFVELGLVRTASTFPYFRPDGTIAFHAQQFERTLS